jgi:hypothetical protein
MVAEYNEKLNDRGVSESIGFLLIFSIVIVGIGLVTLYGYPLLLKQQVSADEKIMEKNIVVLQNDVKVWHEPCPTRNLLVGSGSWCIQFKSQSSLKHHNR